MADTLFLYLFQFHHLTKKFLPRTTSLQIRHHSWQYRLNLSSYALEILSSQHSIVLTNISSGRIKKIYNHRHAIFTRQHCIILFWIFIHDDDDWSRRHVFFLVVVSRKKPWWGSWLSKRDHHEDEEEDDEWFSHHDYSTKKLIEWRRKWCEDRSIFTVKFDVEASLLYVDESRSVITRK